MFCCSGRKRRLKSSLQVIGAVRFEGDGIRESALSPSLCPPTSGATTSLLADSPRKGYPHNFDSVAVLSGINFASLEGYTTATSFQGSLGSSLVEKTPTIGSSIVSPNPGATPSSITRKRKSDINNRKSALMEKLGSLLLEAPDKEKVVFEESI